MPRQDRGRLGHAEDMSSQRARRARDRQADAGRPCRDLSPRQAGGHQPGRRSRRADRRRTRGRDRRAVERGAVRAPPPSRGFAPPRRPAGHARRHRDAAPASAAGGRGASHRAAQDPRARAADEADARRAGVRRLAAGVLFHGGRPRRLPRARSRARLRVPERGSRCGRSACATKPRCLAATARCGRPLCCTTFLDDVRAGVDQDGEAAGPEPQSVEAVGAVRPAEVLPPLRAAERQGPGRTAAAAAKAAATTRPAAAPAVWRARRFVRDPAAAPSA